MDSVVLVNSNSSDNISARLSTAELQKTLVPPIAFHGTRLEAHGQSLPKEEVGGDLIDLVEGVRDVTAYVADISGHGLRAGILMGMVKTVVRYGLLLSQPMSKLLADINSVMPSVKDTSMFATFAALRFNGTGKAEYVSAGHVPLLHYRQSTRDVIQHSVPQLPLGVLAGASYETQDIPYENGDMFVLVTDGILESGGEQDVQQGLERVANVIVQLADCPLSEIVTGIQADANETSEQFDDQTVLLIRPSDAPKGGGHEDQLTVPAKEPDFAQVLESKWRDLLDELADELGRD